MSDDLIGPADSEYELNVSEAFQRTVNRAHEGDDLPVQITVRQAQKNAVIRGAVARGHPRLHRRAARRLMVPRRLTLAPTWQAEGQRRVDHPAASDVPR